MRASAALAVMSAVAASAQSLQNYTSSLDMKIDTAKVPIGTRAEWCRGQTNTCGLLCDNNTDENSCAQDTLEFKCKCASNHSMPGLQFYTQTVPTYICQELFGVCKSENAGKQKEQEACDKNIEALCGQTNPPKVAISSSDNGGDSSESATSATQQSPKQTNGAASSSSSRGLAAPTPAPAGPGAAAAAAAMGFLAYLL